MIDIFGEISIKIALIEGEDSIILFEKLSFDKSGEGDVKKIENLEIFVGRLIPLLKTLINENSELKKEIKNLKNEINEKEKVKKFQKIKVLNSTHQK